MSCQGPFVVLASINASERSIFFRGNNCEVVDNAEEASLPLPKSPDIDFASCPSLTPFNEGWLPFAAS